MSGPAKFRADLPLAGRNGRVWLDGVDITDSVVSIEIKASVASITTVNLELRLRDVDVHGEAMVTGVPLGRG